MVIESNNYHVFSFSLLTRDMPIINNSKATYITIPAVTGEVSILSSHIPYISRIGYGILHIKTIDSENILYIEDGIVEVANNSVNILVEKALYKDQINVEEIEFEINRINNSKPINVEEDNRNKEQMKRLLMQIDIANGKKK